MADGGKAVLISGDPLHASFGAMIRDLAAGLAARGVACELVLLKPGFDGAAFLRRVAGWAADPPAFVFSWNCHVNIAPGGVSIHDRLGIPLFTALVDHPADHWPGLLKTPRHAAVGVVDRRHLAVLAGQPLAVSRVVFFPHAGPPPDPAAPSMAARDIDILFCGNVPAPPDLAAILAAATGCDRIKAARLAARMTERALAEDGDAYPIAVAELGAAGADAEGDGLRAVVGALSAGVEILHRRAVLAGCRGLALTVAGEVEAAPAEAHCLGRVGYAEFLALARRSRLVLNVTPKFRHGSHERIFYATAAGAVSLAEPSAYLAETFREGESIHWLPAPPRLADRVRDILGDLPALQAVADGAAAVQTAHHTWFHRAAVLLDSVAGLRR